MSMQEYDQGLRSRVNTILKGYTGFYEFRPLSLPRSHRVLPLFIRLRTESAGSFTPRQKLERPSANGHLPGSLLVFTTSASLEDFNQRMIYQVKRYLGMRPEEITPEWERFAERNRAEIDRLSPLVTLTLRAS